MWLNYLKIAWRNLLKNKMLSALNIGGLAIGMAAAILIGSYIHQETNVNKWMPEGEHIYRVYRSYQQNQQGGQANTPAVLSLELPDQFPAIKQATALDVGYDLLFKNAKAAHYLDEVAYVDSNFLAVFQIPLINGHAEEALFQPQTAIISENLARKFFDHTDVVGQTLRFNDAMELTITGVYPDLGGRTNLDFDIFMRRPYTNNSWLSYRYETYVLTGPEVIIPELEEKMTNYLDPILLHEFQQANFEISENDLPSWGLQAFPNIHLASANFGTIRSGKGNPAYLSILGLIGILLLLIAAINYINLATARAGSRAQEIGVRKVSGAGRRQLIAQFLVESVLLSGIGVLLAFPLASVLLPFFNQITGQPLQLAGPETPLVIGGLLILSVTMGLLAGLYPALILSGYKPVEILKGEKKLGAGGAPLRKVLVVTQFTGLVVLVILSTVMYRQVQFMLKGDLGFTADQVIMLPLNTDESWRRIEARKDDWQKQAGITAISTASVYPGEYPVDYTVEIEDHEDKYKSPHMIFADAQYDKVIDLKVLDGRFFSETIASDTLNAFVVNRQFVEEYGIEQPIGTRVRFPWQDTWGEIIGVVENYHYEGLDTAIEPLAFYGGPRARQQAAIRFQGDQWPEVESFIRSEWATIEAGHPMRYRFLDDQFATQYTQYQNMTRTFLYGAGLTILVAILGLFGLATFTAQKRTKEIGIRKVLGASVAGIVMMLIRQFISLSIIAGLVATPLAFWFSKHWLQDFAYRIELNIWPFAIGIATALVITIITVSFQSLRAATINPVESLRSE